MYTNGASPYGAGPYGAGPYGAGPYGGPVAYGQRASVLSNSIIAPASTTYTSPIIGGPYGGPVARSSYGAPVMAGRMSIPVGPQVVTSQVYGPPVSQTFAPAVLPPVATTQSTTQIFTGQPSGIYATAGTVGYGNTVHASSLYNYDFEGPALYKNIKGTNSVRREYSTGYGTGIAAPQGGGFMSRIKKVIPDVVSNGGTYTTTYPNYGQSYDSSYLSHEALATDAGQMTKSRAVRPT